VVAGRDIGLAALYAPTVGVGVAAYVGTHRWFDVAFFTGVMLLNSVTLTVALRNFRRAAERRAAEPTGWSPGVWTDDR
jgi:hypothetical protein